MDSMTSVGMPAGSHPAPTAPLTAHLASTAHQGASQNMPKALHLGREHVKWGHEVWERIDRAVHHEINRTRVAAKFLPHHRVDPHVTTVPSDLIQQTIDGVPLGVRPAAVGGVVQPLPPPFPLLNVDEGEITRLIEIWVEFSMTP